MTKLVYAFLILSTFNSGNELNCKNLKTGKFKSFDKDYGTTIIIRSEKEQIEENSKLGIKAKYKIKWISECSYQLYDVKIYKGDSFRQGEKTDTLTNLITEVKDNSYKVITTSNYADLKIESELEIVK